MSPQLTLDLEAGDKAEAEEEVGEVAEAEEVEEEAEVAVVVATLMAAGQPLIPTTPERTTPLLNGAL